MQCLGFPGAHDVLHGKGEETYLTDVSFSRLGRFPLLHAVQLKAMVMGIVMVINGHMVTAMVMVKRMLMVMLMVMVNVADDIGTVKVVLKVLTMTMAMVNTGGQEWVEITARISSLQYHVQYSGMYNTW